MFDNLKSIFNKQDSTQDLSKSTIEYPIVTANLNYYKDIINYSVEFETVKYTVDKLEDVLIMKDTYKSLLNHNIQPLFGKWYNGDWYLNYNDSIIDFKDMNQFLDYLKSEFSLNEFLKTYPRYEILNNISAIVKTKVKSFRGLTIEIVGDFKNDYDLLIEFDKICNYKYPILINSDLQLIPIDQINFREDLFFYNYTDNSFVKLTKLEKLIEEKIIKKEELEFQRKIQEEIKKQNEIEKIKVTTIHSNVQLDI